MSDPQTFVHWALWRDRQEEEWIAIGKTVFTNGRGETKFRCTPTNAWGWRCVTLPLGVPPPEIPAKRPNRQQPPLIDDEPASLFGDE